MSRLVPCPHCLCESYIRDSEQITRVTRELTLICKNANCGHTWIAHLSATRTLSESATPDASVHLPITKGLFSNN